MTLEIIAQDTTPAGNGTYLYNTTVISYDISSKNINETAISVTGKPIIRWLGESHDINFTLLIEEKGDYVGDETFGLSDLETLRKWSIGFDTPDVGKKCWIRDTDGDYFLQDWKVGRVSGLKFPMVQGFPNVVGATLYRATFKFHVIDDTTDKYTMFRW
jgi:hypothetical protein